MRLGPRREVFPEGLGLVFLCPLGALSPQEPSPGPQPSRPSRLRLAEPLSLAVSPRQRAPSICRKTPFSAPLEHLQASASCPTPSLSMKNPGQDGRGAGPSYSEPAPTPSATLQRGRHGRHCPGPARSRPCPGPGLAREGEDREAAQDQPSRGRTDSWRGRRSCGRGGRGFTGVTFQKNSQRVAGMTPRGEKKFSYHVEREDSQSIFQTGSAFPTPG